MDVLIKMFDITYCFWLSLSPIILLVWIIDTPVMESEEATYLYIKASLRTQFHIIDVVNTGPLNRKLSVSDLLPVVATTGQMMCSMKSWSGF